MTFYQRLFDTVLTRTDAESAHRAAFAMMRGAARVPGVVAIGVEVHGETRAGRA